jgi:hypothetical protein
VNALPKKMHAIYSSGYSYADGHHHEREIFGTTGAQIGKYSSGRSNGVKRQDNRCCKTITPSLIRHTEADGYQGTIDLKNSGFCDFLQQELPGWNDIDLKSKARLINAPRMLMI